VEAISCTEGTTASTDRLSAGSSRIQTEQKPRTCVYERERNVCDVITNANVNQYNVPMSHDNHVTSDECSDQPTGLTHTTQLSLHGIVLPKFHDARKQNAIQFICDLNDYFRLKNVDESLKLSLVTEAPTDRYTQDWFSTTRKDLRNYERFC
jgi:hypothetical protein